MSNALARFVAGLALKGVLRKATGRAEPAGMVRRTAPARARRARRGRDRDQPARRTGTVAAAPPRRGSMFGLMLAGAAVGFPLMLIFESTITRIIGVLALAIFIVAGVFAIADPAFLDVDEEESR